jgi:hypothetical protein
MAAVKVEKVWVTNTGTRSSPLRSLIIAHSSSGAVAHGGVGGIVTFESAS